MRRGGMLPRAKLIILVFKVVLISCWGLSVLVGLVDPAMSGEQCKQVDHKEKALLHSLRKIIGA